MLSAPVGTGDPSAAAIAAAEVENVCPPSVTLPFTKASLRAPSEKLALAPAVPIGIVAVRDPPAPI